MNSLKTTSLRLLPWAVESTEIDSQESKIVIRYRTKSEAQNYIDVLQRNHRGHVTHTFKVIFAVVAGMK